ncbi:MAG: TetR/AcrR family transcriptional regulator [Burkholderiaceae bacterium]|nr:TetR/AcrR family transcriptional regulator [Burkholderiaceae bacterium]
MARGRAPGYDSQREDILARAAELFATRGYPGTSMNEVAKACGVSKPALYHYVRDKSQLLAEIATGHVTRLQALVEEVTALDLPPEACVRQLIERFVEEYAGARNAHRVLTEDVKFLDPVDQERVLSVQRRVVTAFAQAVAQARPELVAASLNKPLTMLLFGMMNWMFTWLQPEGKLSHSQMAPVVADLFLGGLGAVRLDPVAKPPIRRTRSAQPTLKNGEMQ